MRDPSHALADDWRDARIDPKISELVAVVVLKRKETRPWIHKWTMHERCPLMLRKKTCFCLGQTFRR